MTDNLEQQVREAASSGTENSRFSDRAVFGLIAVLFVAVSLFSWHQPVSSMEMNRNDAACYLIMAKNLTQHGVYSLDQAAPFRPHTEWPPGIPLLYTVPMAFLDFPLTTTGTSVIHAWTLLMSLTSLWLVYRFLRTLISQAGAFAVVAALATTKAFLDSAQAAVADTASVGAAFLVLHWMQQYFQSQFRGATGADSDLASTATTRGQIALHIALALAPLVKPYLGMLHAAYLAKIIQHWWRDSGAGKAAHLRLLRGLVTLGVCCIPFAGFIAYSVVAAQQTEQISAITWLTTDNPVEIHKTGETADHKSLKEWINGGLGVLKYHLVYNAIDAAVPALSWWRFSEWPAPWRAPVLALLLGTMLVGAVQLQQRREVLSVAYAGAMFAFFIVFACDSPRYFTVLSPMCGLFAWIGGTTMFAWGQRILARRPFPQFSAHPLGTCPRSVVVTAALLLSAGLSTACWINHRAGCQFDAVPFYEELYATLHAARDDAAIGAIVVPFQLRDMSIVETGKPILTWQDYEQQRDAATAGWAFIKVKHDPSGRISPTPATAFGGETTTHPRTAEFHCLDLRTPRQAPQHAVVRNQ